MRSFIFKPVLLSITASLLLTACNQATPEDYIQSANAHLAKNDVPAAIIELKNAIVAAPQNSQARILLAQSHLHLGNALSAIKELKKAAELGININQVNPLMVEALLLSQNYKDTISFVSELEKTQLDANLNLFKFYQAWAQLLSNKPDKASETLAKLPVNNDDQYSLAHQYLLAFLKQEQENFDALDKQLAALPNGFIDLKLLQGQLNYNVGEFDRSVEYFTAYEQAKPLYIPATFALANAHISNRTPEKADEYVEKLVATIPNSPQANKLAATAAFDKGEYEKALTFIETAMEQGDKALTNQLLAGLASFRLKNYEQAYFYLNPLKDVMHKRHPGQKALLATKLALKRHDEVFSELSGLEEVSDADISFINATSYALINTGKADKAKMLLSQTEGLDLATDQLIQTGVLKLSMQDNSGIELLEKALQNDPSDTLSRLTYATALFQNKKFKEAHAIADDLIAKNERAEQAYNLKATILLAEDKVIDAEAIFKKLLTIDSSSTTANLYFARKSLQQNQPQQAVKYLSSFLAKNPTHLQGLGFYYYAKEQLNQHEEGKEFIRKAFRNNPDNLEIGVFFAAIELRHKKPLEAEKILAKFKEKNNLLSRNYWQLYSRVVAQTNNPEKLMRILTQWSVSDFADHQPFMSIASHYESKRNLTRAMIEIDKGLKRLNDNPQLLVMKASLLIEMKELAAAREILAKLEGTIVNPILISGFEGRILAYENKLSEAEPLIETYYQTFPSSGLANLAFMIKTKLSKTDEAEQFLIAHIEKYPNENNSRMVLSNHYLTTGKTAKAIKLYEESLEKSGQNVIILNNLAWLLFEEGQVERAIEYSNKAVVIAPKNSDVLDTNGFIKLRQSNAKEAVSILEKAYRIKPSNNDIALHYAEALIATGKSKQANKVLTEMSGLSNKQAGEQKALRDKI